MAASYEVTVTIAPSHAASIPAFVSYMCDKHLPEILATGCFANITFSKLDDSTYRTIYLAASRADYDRYIAEHQAAMKDDFMKHFPSGLTASRQVWDVMRTFWR